jgi:hypothetical protein
MAHQQNPASGGTAIGAAVLAFLCGMRYLTEGGAFLVQLVVLGVVPEYVVGILWNGLLTVALFLGGVLLLLRRTLGRTLIVAGAALALAVAILAAGEARTYFFAGVEGNELLASDFSTFMLFGMAGVTLVLAVIRPTSDWLEGKPRAGDEEPPKPDRLPGW